MFSLPFNGTLQSSLGPPVSSSNFDPDFRGYLTREALQLHPGEILKYQAKSVNNKRGTLLLWMKPGWKFPGPLLPLLQFQDPAESSGFELSIGKNMIQFSRRVRGKSAAQVLRCGQARFFPGKWDLLALAWRDSSASVYLNGELQTCDSSEKSLTEPSSKERFLAVGLPPGTADDEEDFSESLRDLVIYNETKAPEWIRSLYNQQSGTPNLVYRVCDLMHWAGKTASDKDAAGGVAWTGDTLLAEQDNLKLPHAGDYQLTFLIKPLAVIRAGSLRAQVWNTSGAGKRELIASRENDELRAGAPGQLFAAVKTSSTYGPLTLSFHVSEGAIIDYRLDCFLAGKYSFLVDTATVQDTTGSWRDIRRVEDLKHTMGVQEEDPQAKGGRAWSNQNALNLGPYTCIGQPGRYRATWRIKVSDDVAPNAPLLLMKVFAHDGFLPNRRGNKDYAGADLRASDFEKRNAWLTKSLDFNYDGSDMMEFYVHAKILDPGAILLDTVTIQELQSK